MPNFNTHLMAGITVGVGMNVAKQWGEKAMEPQKRFDWGEMLIWGGIGGAAACLPDLLEPSTNNPNHRGFFHSVVIAAVVLYSIKGKHSRGLPPAFKVFLSIVGYSYLSHLALDALTPRSLRFI